MSKFYETNEFGLIITIAELYDNGCSVAEISQKLRKSEQEVNEAIINICIAREIYRQSNS